MKIKKVLNYLPSVIGVFFILVCVYFIFFNYKSSKSIEKKLYPTDAFRKVYQVIVVSDYKNVNHVYYFMNARDLYINKKIEEYLESEPNVHELIIRPFGIKR